MWIEIGITIPIALLQWRWPNGGGTPTTQTSQPSDGIRYTISTCSVQLLSSSNNHFTSNNNHIRFLQPFYDF